MTVTDLDEFASLVARQEPPGAPTTTRSAPASTLRSTIEKMVVSDDDLDSLPDPVPLVRGLFAQDSLGVIFGAYGTCKSLINQDLSYSIGLGRDFQGRPVEQGPVLYVAAEGQSGLKRRRAAYREHHNIDEPAPVTWITGVVDMLSITTVSALAEIAADIQPKLIVLDTLNRLSPGGEEDTRHMSAFIRAIDELRTATGACVLAVHHSGKDQARGARGHSSFPAAMDTILEVVRVGPDKVTAHVRKQKDMDSDGEQLHFTIERAAGSVLVVPAFGVAHEAEMSGAKAKAFATFLEITIEAGITSTEWLAASEISRSAFYRARAELVTEGRVLEQDKRYYPGTTPNPGQLGLTEP